MLESSKRRLVPSADRTVTDEETSLIWTASVFGVLPNGQIAEGGGRGFSWSDAAKRFGTGAKLRYGCPVGEVLADTYSAYRLPATASVTVGQYADWRLPTVQEMKTLLHVGSAARREIDIDVFTSFERVWSASPAGWCERYEGAWALCERFAICDLPISEKHFVRLVRGGTIFNALHR